MKKYRIGELAKEMGVTHEYLKYYEKNEVIIPERDEDSNYRYFTFADAGRVADSKKFRNLGFSVKDVKNFIWYYSLEETLELFKQKRDLYSEDLFRLQKNMEYIDEVLSCFPSGKFINNKWYLIEQEDFFFFPHTKEKEFYLNKADSIRVQKWIDQQPLTYKTLYVPLENNDSSPEYIYGFWADKNIAYKLKLDINKPAQHIKKGRCFVYYFESSKDSSQYTSIDFNPSAINFLDKPISLMKQCGLEPSASAAFCKLLHSSKINNVNMFYWAMYIPVL